MFSSLKQTNSKMYKKLLKWTRIKSDENRL